MTRLEVWTAARKLAQHHRSRVNRRYVRYWKRTVRKDLMQQGEHKTKQDIEEVLAL